MGIFEDTTQDAPARLLAWLATCPALAAVRTLRCDYTDQNGDNAGIFPTGVRELARKYDVCGGARVNCQMRFTLYLVLAKAPGDEAAADAAARLLLALQGWVQAQSLRGLAPRFGDEPNAERMTAQNGALYDADDEGTATYKVELCATFTKLFKE